MECPDCGTQMLQFLPIIKLDSIGFLLDSELQLEMWVCPDRRFVTVLDWEFLN